MSDRQTQQIYASNSGSDVSTGASNMEVLGQVVWLMSQSSLHKNWPIASLLQWVVPALMHQQYRVYMRAGLPVAYVSWAWLSADKESAYVRNPRGLQPVDWKCGHRGWVIDFISPFGETKEVMRDLRHHIFKDEVGRALRVKPGSDVMRITYIHGAQAVQKSRNRECSPTVNMA